MKIVGRFLLLFCAVSLGFLHASATGPVEQKRPVNVLIIDGFSNHDWKMTTARILEILQRAGGFAPVVSTSPDATATAEEWDRWNPPIAEADVVLMNCNDLKNPVHWPERVKSALDAFIQKGGGMYALHSANNAFEHWPAYNRMIGLGWRNQNVGTALIVEDDGQVKRVPPGEGARTSHGKRIDALVQRQGNHPIHRGLPAQWRAADVEIYTYVRGPAEDVEVISSSRDNAFGLSFPVEWVVTYGKGHVYSSSLGHLWAGDANPPSIRCVAFQTLLVRSLRWLAGREIEETAPADFPTANAVSLRADTPVASTD
jgi:uncharacterized protein